MSRISYGRLDFSPPPIPCGPDACRTAPGPPRHTRGERAIRSSRAEGGSPIAAFGCCCGCGCGCASSKKKRTPKASTLAAPLSLASSMIS
eukprot:4074975-Prymnesium_polylepis.1